MKNTRNKVRLTESQLHNVIKESVKQVLTELDWKTYANAANKMRRERGDADYWKEKGEKLGCSKIVIKICSKKYLFLVLLGC